MSTEQPGTDSAPLTTAEITDKLAAKFDFGDESEVAQPEGEEQPIEAQAEQPQEAQPAVDDSEEVDFDGIPLKLPKEHAQKLKSTVEGYKDYTKKTQEVAEARRVVEAQSRLMQEQQAFQADVAQELSDFQRYDAQIAQYKNVDWASLSMEDTVRYRAQLDTLKDAKEDLGRKIQGKKQQFDQKMRQHQQSLRQAQEKAVKLAIPDWSEATTKDVATAVQSIGYTADELNSIYDPRFVLLAHKAAQWDKLQASKPAATARANSAAPMLKPGAGQTQPSKAIQTMNFRKAVKNAPDRATKHALIMDRLEAKL